MLALLLPLLASGALAAPDLVVPRHGTAEIVLHAAQNYNGASGTPNPFTEVTFQLQVTSPTGRSIPVEGFFNGDGVGGSLGNVFVARVYADEPGNWTWTSTSSDAGLHAKNGSFTVSGTLAGRWGHGGLVVRPATPRHFSHADGTPFFAAGKMLDAAIGGTIGQTLPMLSEVWTDADRRALLDRAASLSANKLAIYLANSGDFSAQWPTTPWVGSAASNDKTRFDLARWKMFDQWTMQMRDEGFGAQFFFYADNSAFGNLPLADRQRLIRYGMARLSAYANTYFILSLEWDEGWTVADTDACAAYLQSKNPWRRPHSVHCLPGLFDFPDRAWADYMPIQSGTGAEYGIVHSRNLANAAQAVKPAIEEECSSGSENTAGRQKTWAAFTAGVTGVGTGVFLRHLVTFVSSVDVDRMGPDDGLALAGTAYVLAERGRQYVAYLPLGGSVDLDLSHTAGSFQAQWYNPATGTFQSPVTVAAGGSLSMTAPAAGDWVLSLRRTCTGGPAPGLVGGLRVDAGGAISWSAAAAADGYDTIVGDLLALPSGGLAGSLRGCLERNGADTATPDAVVPPEGGGRYYLVRARSCAGALGTYEGPGAPAVDPRDAAAAASARDCP
ncbi:MAG TPA: DUF5060 domain-containing protein [Candidatus Polarisedimenticolaceae bacterium]|nr:DUF5060 domain-containing protein [Candidatus Polarisedimenticolaceae bacterium]